jgi:hypothetical protein
MVTDAPTPAPQQKRGGFAVRILMVFAILTAAVFLPVAVVFIVGMLPGLVAFMVDPTREKTRALTVGILNFVACFPFLLEVALQPQTMQAAYNVILDPVNIIIMYGGALAGYSLDWTMAGISNVIMTSRAKQRLDSIERRQAELIRRYGREVTGEIPLDPDGFPLHKIED